MEEDSIIPLKWDSESFMSLRTLSHSMQNVVAKKAIMGLVWEQCIQRSIYSPEQSHLASRTVQWVKLHTCMSFCKILPRRVRMHWNAHTHLSTLPVYMQEKPPATIKCHSFFPSFPVSVSERELAFLVMSWLLLHLQSIYWQKRSCNLFHIKAKQCLYYT